MFVKNQSHLQPPLLSDIQSLPEKQRQRLVGSWAGVFYEQCFCRISEETFAVLYADCPSRPNTPVNVLVGLELLKAGFGWSDEELYDAFTFNLQVRYALGYQDLGEGDFALRTLYHFRQRLACYHQEQGVNLLTEVFEALTDQQVAAWGVRTGYQRLDSTQIASNIRDASRLQLAVEAVQRLYRLLDEGERAAYAARLEPFVEREAYQYVYRVKGQEATRAHLREVGQALHWLLAELAPKYESAVSYQVAQRFFEENYQAKGAKISARTNAELPAGCLQSLDDLEATYRQKARRVYKGYVGSASETCDPQNELQLIIQVQVAPNNVQDTTLLCAGLASLKARTGVETVITDAGYCSAEVDQALRAQQVVQVPTDMLGRDPRPNRLTLLDFTIATDAAGTPQRMSCPGGQTILLGRSRSQRFTARWDGAVCQTCNCYATGRCRGKRGRGYRLSFSLQDYDRAERRRRCLAERQAPKHLRPAVEATMRSLKHHFPASKLPVRGLFRVTCMFVAAAAMVNVRRIARHLNAPRPPQLAPVGAPGAAVAESEPILLFFALSRALGHLLMPAKARLGT
jgi:hypothetical protein